MSGRAGTSLAHVGRRTALGALGASALGFLVFGPRPRRERADGRLVLDYWEKWTGHEAKAMQAIVDAYNASQSRVFVRYFTMSAIDQKALIAIAGGDPPDIVGLWTFNVPAYAESGAIIPLDDLAAARGLTRDAYAPRVWDLMHHEGRLWAAVSTCGTVALYYNKGLFRDAGLDPDRPPRTIAELDAANEKLTRTDSSGRIDRMGFIHTEPGWWSWLWGYPFGGSVYQPPERAMQAGLATAAAEANVKAYRWVQSYPERWGVSNLVAFQSGLGFYGTAENPFLLGKLAMEVQGPWLANMVNAYRPELDYGVASMPVGDEGLLERGAVGMVDGDVLVVPRGAKDPEASMEFIAFTQRPENIERLSLAHCKNSPLAASSGEFLSRHPNRHVAVHDAIAKSPGAFCFPYTRAWPEYVAQFNSAMERMWRLQSPAESALADVQRRAQEAMDRVASMRRTRAGMESQT